MGAEFRQLARPTERTVVDLVPEHRIALRAHAQCDEDGQQIGREVRPGRGLDLGQHIAGERRLHLQPAWAGGARPAVLVRDLHPELGEGPVDQREVAGRAVAHHHIAAGNGAQSQKGRDFVVVLVETELPAPQRRAALDGDARGAYAFDAHTHHHHKAAKLLHVRLGRRIGQHRGAARAGRAEHEILGGGNRRIVQPVVGRLELAVAPDQQRAVGALHHAAKAAEYVHMRVDLAHAQGTALDVVLQPRHAKARQQRRHQHDGGAHFFRQTVLGCVKHGGAVVQVQRSGHVVHVHVAAQGTENVENLAHIGDVGHAVQAQRLVGEQGGAKYRQNSVFIRRGCDAAAKRRAAEDDEIGHGWGMD